MDFETTAEIPIPKDPLERVIGQEEAVNISRIVSSQKRHLLMVGAPGTGKSMIARAIASLLPPPTHEVSVLHNIERPERPILSVRTSKMLEMEKGEKEKEWGESVHPADVPSFVSERLGFRCRRCGDLSTPRALYCTSCGADKHPQKYSPFGDLLPSNDQRDGRVHAVRIDEDGEEEPIIYEKTDDDRIRKLTHSDFKKRAAAKVKKLRKVIVSLSRPNFVQVVGNNETELLGDVRHDPYGSHPEIGTPAYLRVTAGAIHEAHEGVLYVDEMTTLGDAQKYLLTAMQDRNFLITGRNPSSAGSTVRVESVPCDFILVGAMNINDLPSLSPALRSRIRGSGYEIVLNTNMEDTPSNQEKMAQFVAQEIQMDGRIPHATADAFGKILEESRKICRATDNKSGLTLRLRVLSGIIKLAGDFASLNESEFIDSAHMGQAIKQAKSAEEQLEEKYGNIWSAGLADYGARSKKGSETA
ncbi:AAA family ATPase [Candidatus Micrarchaeota archaeon]|nr:AAA family ATPase [Candidatus Micrarchaeota archaeon]MBD3418026.1 AAA family ATPase [Candidatus Micrarchaeota archaeon]